MPPKIREFCQIKKLVLGILFLLFALPAHAQMASFEGRSLSHLDPVINQSTGNGYLLEQMRGSNDMQEMIDIAPEDFMRKLARPVGRLTIRLGKAFTGVKEKGGYCTASLIDKNLLLTNYHCVPGLGGKVKDVMLTMGYLAPRKRTGVAQYYVDPTPVEASKALDYAILRVEGNPGAEWGTVSLSSHTPESRNSLFIIHHPLGLPKHVSLGRCATASPAIDGNDILHICDTLFGSSGAPIFDSSSRKVIGLHFSAIALKKLNAGKRIASIAQKSALVARLVRRGARPEKPRQNTGNNAELIAMRKRMKALEDQLRTERKRRKKQEKKVAIGIFRDPEPRRRKRLSFEPETVLIPSGTFSMGCVSGKGCQGGEKPVHQITVSSFYLGKYETTVSEYMACVKAGVCKVPEWQERGSKYNIKTGSNNYYKKLGNALTRDRHPIVGVSWDNAVSYAKWLSGKTGEVWRLPTEAEWEYAARGNKRGENRTKYSWGNSIGRNRTNCRNCKDKWKYTAPVGKFSANKFGLHDMHGNVWEWVNDWYDKNYYKNSPTNNPENTKSGSLRVIRGGGWYSGARDLRSASRDFSAPYSRRYLIGFRLMRQPS